MIQNCRPNKYKSSFSYDVWQLNDNCKNKIGGKTLQQQTDASEKIYHPFLVVGSCNDGLNNLSKFEENYKTSLSTRSIDRLSRNFSPPSLSRRQFTISLDNELHKRRSSGSGRQHPSNLTCSTSVFHNCSSLTTENILPGVECKRITSSKREPKNRTVKDKKVNGKKKKKIRIKPKRDISPTSPRKNNDTLDKETKKSSRITFSFTKRRASNNNCNERISIKSFFNKKKNTVHDPSIKFSDPSPCSSPSKKRNDYPNHNNNNHDYRKSLPTSPQKSSSRRVYYSEKQSLSDVNGIPMVPPSTPAVHENETVESMADLKSQRNIVQKLLKIGSKRKEKEAERDRKEKERLKQAEEENRKNLIAFQRRQIYYLNKIMTKLESDNFEKFKLTQLGAPV